MFLIPLHTRLLKPGDDLAKVLWGAGEFQTGDILVISSKAVATVEGRIFRLFDPSPSPSPSPTRGEGGIHSPSREAREWAKKTGRSPEFCEVVLREVKFRRGKTIGFCSGVILTELKPRGLSRGTILAANAGLDESNAPKGFAIGWPRDPVRSVKELRVRLERLLQGWLKGRNGKKGRKGGKAESYKLPATSYKLGIVLSDSCCMPRRKGVTAHALTVSGITPFESQVGRRDLFGKKLHITTEAVADQLATAANFLMGNAGQGIPAVIIRNHGLSLKEGWPAGRSSVQQSEGWVPGIRSEEDLFRGVL